MDLTAKTVFIIAIATSRMIFPGIDPSTRPPEDRTTPFHNAVKSLTMELTCGAEYSAGAKAGVSVPEGLGVGQSVNLTVEPHAVLDAEESLGGAPYVRFEVRQYWGSSERVPDGQPKTTRIESSTPEPRQDERTPDRHLPRGIYAHWPGYQDPPLRPAASAPGEYVLTTDFCGRASVRVAEDQDFLKPINLKSPASAPDLSKPIRVEWEPVPNAAAYLLNAAGGTERWSAVWTSSARPELTADIEHRPIPEDELHNLLEQKALLPPEVTSCIIPAGIFAESNSVMLTVTALGRDTVFQQENTVTGVIVRSTAAAVLYSKPFEEALGAGD